MSGTAIVSVDALDPTAPLHRWAETLSRCIGRTPGELRAQERKRCEALGTQPFHGRIEYGDLGALGLCRLQATPHRFSRAQAHAAGSDRSPLMLILLQRGHCHVEQQGSQGALQAGDWCLLDARLPFTWTSPSPCELIVVSPPRPVDAGLVEAVSRSLARRADGSLGAARLMNGLVLDVFQQLDHLPVHGAAAAADAITGLLWSALRDQAVCNPPPSMRETQRQRLKTYIEDRLADPDLSPASIAEHCRLSVRSVHRAFAYGLGGSVTDYIWRRRLAHCAASLKDPAQAHRSITDIALSWGFANPSHFSRSFRQSTGSSPRSYRLTAQGNVAPRCRQ